VIQGDSGKLLLNNVLSKKSMMNTRKASRFFTYKLGSHKTTSPSRAIDQIAKTPKYDDQLSKEPATLAVIKREPASDIPRDVVARCP